MDESIQKELEKAPTAVAPLRQEHWEWQYAICPTYDDMGREIGEDQMDENRICLACQELWPQSKQDCMGGHEMHPGQAIFRGYR